MILDLDGDGVEADALTYFDHAGDGWSELSRWANEDDGVLVWDRNGDGIINNGAELFGNNTVLSGGGTAENGFAALADLDSNGDGVVDGSDEAWGELRVMRWNDANDDGLVQDSEKTLVTLASLNIASLNTGYTASAHVDESGNEHRQVGSYTKSDGTMATMTDVWFVTSAGDTTYDRSGIPAHSKAIAALPDIKGHGRVYGLRDAMALDDARDGEGHSRLTAPYYSNSRVETRSLREMVAAFVATDGSGSPVLDKSARKVLAEKILLRWSGAEGAVARDYGVSNLFYTQAPKLAVKEAFEGEQWLNGEGYRRPGYETAQKVERGYLFERERVYAQLMLQSHLSDLQSALTVSLKAGVEGGSTAAADYSFDFSGVEALLTAEKDARRGKWLRSLAAMFGTDEAVMEAMRATAPDWVYEYRFYSDYLSRAVFGGYQGDRHNFVGDCGCSGGLRDNVFYTTDGGSDRLEGRGGDDTYYLGYDTGHDRIEEIWRDSDFDGDSHDVIKVAPGIGTERVKLSRTRDDLIVSLLDAGGVVTDSLTVKGYYANAVSRIEAVLFEDGSRWEAAEFADVVLAGGQGTDGTDIYDTGLDGVVSVAQGGKGSDVYLLGRTSGNDVVREADYNDSGSRTESDVVRLKAGLVKADVRLSRSSRNHLMQGLDGLFCC